MKNCSIHSDLLWLLMSYTENETEVTQGRKTTDIWQLLIKRR